MRMLNWYFLSDNDDDNVDDDDNNNSKDNNEQNIDDNDNHNKYGQEPTSKGLFLVNCSLKSTFHVHWPQKINSTRRHMGEIAKSKYTLCRWEYIFVAFALQTFTAPILDKLKVDQVYSVHCTLYSE